MRVLCTCLPGSGHFLPMLPLARALAAAGHEVAFATAGEFCPSVTKRGFAVFPAGISLPQQLEEAGARYREGDQPPSKERFETFVPRMLGGVAAPARAADLAPIIESWLPDVLVHDETEFAGPAVAARFGIPWADQSVGILRPLVMARRAAAEAAPLWRTGAGREVPAFGGLFEYLYLDVCPPSLQTAEIGQVAVAHRVHNLSVAGPDDGPLPGWVASLRGRPTVYVSLGTVFSRDNPVFRAILAGLRDEAVNVIVTVGPDNDPAELGEQREGVYVERFIPQALLLPHCTAVLNQGGTAILDILGRGLPLLVLPQGANQFHNAEACVRAGVGRALLPGSVTPSAVRSEVRALLDVASYRERAAVIAAELAAMPGPAEGVRLLERLAEERAPIPEGRSAEMGGRSERAGGRSWRPGPGGGATSSAARGGDLARTLERTRAADVGGRIGERVRLCGWVDGSAASTVRDRSGTVRVAVADARGLPPPESAVEVVGTVTAAGVEAAEVRVVGPVLADLPIDASSPLESRLDWRFLDLRRPRNRLIFEVQTTAEVAMREYWAARGFLELHSPKLRPNRNRNGRELFSVPYFDKQAYLVQSPQFYKQMAMAAGFEAVFEIGPVFRANPNVTSRHDTEFTSVDVEMSWVHSHEDVMAFEEAWLQHVIAAVEARHGAEITRLFGVTVEVPSVPFPRAPLAYGQSLVAAAAPGQPPGDLDPAGEKALGEYVRTRWGHDLVFVTEYPAATRPFYHMLLSEGSPLTRGFDLLWKGMEVTTGAQREHRFDVLVGQAEARGIPLEPIRYYLDGFRFGCPPHGGFGLGLTRMLMCLLGIDNVREATFLYRGVDRLSP